jgi:hypothetical protein
LRQEQVLEQTGLKEEGSRKPRSTGQFAENACFSDFSGVWFI